ncbi:hypothetical protein BDV24DRAFT_163889 [Aspergillus arachidicola]|uniref:Uncharacterized protein n=1 Tax=Aspergillus arachidicola TaxID=656916 RepID=A0A5N6Y618_9EURO|nr:hypothetical protein BDV24DRAFT_163889 [Aspergillus arachidicola]
MSGLQDSKWADGPVTAAAAGAGGDPNRGGRRGRDGKKPPADRVTVNKGWCCKFGCKTIHPGKPCPMIEFGQRIWAIREQYQEDINAAAWAPVPPASPRAADLHGASAPSRRGAGTPRGANTPTPGGSSIRPLPAAADGNNNSSVGNRNEGGGRQLNHRQKRSRARLQAFQAQRQQQQQQQQHTSTGDTRDTEMAMAPAGESQPENTSAPGAVPDTDALDESARVLCVRTKEPPK